MSCALTGLPWNQEVIRLLSEPYLHFKLKRKLFLNHWICWYFMAQFMVAFLNSPCLSRFAWIELRVERLYRGDNGLQKAAVQSGDEVQRSV